MNLQLQNMLKLCTSNDAVEKPLKKTVFQICDRRQNSLVIQVYFAYVHIDLCKGLN